MKAKARAWRRGVLALGLAVAGLAGATEPVPDSLPKLDPARPADANPYRGQAAPVPIGQTAFEQHCLRCHGEGAQGTAEAPDLRRLNDFCRRLAADALRLHCLSDVDAYFLRSVQGGKIRAGLVYMPPWKDVLPPETIWAIRSYIETQLPPPPRTLPDLPPGGAVVPTAAAASGH